MQCRRNPRSSCFRKVLVGVIITCAVTFGCNSASADSLLNQTEIRKQSLIEKYLKSTFSRGDKLLRMVGIPRITYVCPESFCNSLTLRLKSDFPNFVSQSEAAFHVEPDGSYSIYPSDPGGGSNASEISILFFSSSQALNNFKLRYPRPPGSNWEFRNDGNCRVGRHIAGTRVVNVFVFVVVQEKLRESEACVLAEVMRGSGMEFGNTYASYSKQAASMTDVEFERMIVMETRNLARLHWAMPTTPGMSSEHVKDILEEHILSVDRLEK